MIRRYLEYADDTLLIGLTSPQLQAMLTRLECIALECGMHLNTPLVHSALYFLNGSQVPTKEVFRSSQILGQCRYLEKSFDVAFKNSAALAEEAYKKLRLVWNIAH